MYKFNVSSILVDNGASMEICEEQMIDSATFGVDGCDIIKPVKVLGVFTDMGNDVIEFRGKITTEYQLQCDRCNAPVVYHVDNDVEQKFTTNNSAGEELICIDGNIVDLYPIILEELKINIPMKILCKIDCKGLCNVCGINLNNEQCNCESTDIDPRLSVLKDLFSDK